MSQALINIIVGALIGAIPSLILTWMNNRSQLNRDILQRRWAREDSWRSQKNALEESQYNKIEEFVYSVIQIMKEATLLVANPETDYQMIKSSRLKERLSNYIIKSPPLIAMAETLKDQVLVEELVSFVSLIHDENEYLNCVLQEKQSYDPEPTITTKEMILVDQNAQIHAKNIAIRLKVHRLESWGNVS